MYEITGADHGRSRSSRATMVRQRRDDCCGRSTGNITHLISPFTALLAAIIRRFHTTVFTDAGKVAGFIIQKGRIRFEAFKADDKAAGVYKTQHRAAMALRELAAQVMPDGDL
jgi:hypothetical protein